jgi:hypothetical protein
MAQTTGTYSYGCCRCQKRHMTGDPLFEAHIMDQSKHGMKREATTTCPHTAWTDDAEACSECGATAASRDQYE